MGDDRRSRRDLRVIVIGAGMAGILSVIRLREIGLPDVTVYEKAERLGGTWRENRYPGVACDVPSHLYSYSFAPNPEWTLNPVATYGQRSACGPAVCLILSGGGDPL